MRLLSRLFPLLSTLLAVALLAGCDGTGPSDEGGSTIFPQPEPQVQSFPRWSPDGERILYYDHGLEYDSQSNRVEQNPDRRGLWTMGTDGSDRQQVLAGGSIYGDWSPGGDSLVFEAGGQIYKAAFESGVVDTASIVRLTPSGRYFDPDWSPTGKRVAYRNSIGDTTGVWISPADGSQVREYFAKGGTPQWFPDGQRLLYSWNGALFIETTDHSSKTQIYSPPDRDDPHRINGTSISPDGDRVAMGIDSQVWVIEDNGSGKRELTDTAVRWHAAGQPDWSPGGDHIVYIGPEHTIWVMDADGTDKQQLTTRPEGPVGRDSSS